MKFAFFAFFIFSTCQATIPLSEGLHAIFARNADLRKIGENCTKNSDCASGAICQTTCQCKLSSHIAIDDQCWKKIDPGTTGCTYDEQCDGVWPNTKCMDGKCECGEMEELVETKEGNICVVPGNCATNGVNGALYERATHRIATCLTFMSKKDNINQFIGCDEYPEVYDCIVGTCCPTRGMTCIQPKHEGDGEKDDGRWYYNSITNRCHPFKYRGNGGNSNNFLSQSQCESYCSNRCPRGDPQILAKTQDSPNYYCKPTQDTHQCCPTPFFICSSLGGVKLDKSTLLPYSTGSARRGADILDRYYWDTSDLQCKKFKYLGQGGNFNNFGSKNECLNFCSLDLCKYGTPLRDPSDNIQRCSANSAVCPESHECRESVCCPKPLTICSLSINSDNCDGEMITKWTYSLEHGMCKSVLIADCGKSGNLFESLEECQVACSSVQAEPKCPIGRAYKSGDNLVQRCSATKPCPTNYECIYTGSIHACCPAKEFTCKQPQSPGTKCGLEPLTRWSYDPNTNKCVPFEYLGCTGNDNNFQTRMDCVETCERSNCPDGGDPLIDSTNGRIISCDKNEDCPSTHSCTRQLYTNRTSCCPSRKWICSHDADDGIPCGTTSKRFYFDPTTETCRQFEYLGCGGNANSFSNRVACYQFCQSASCASAEIIYQPSNLDEPFDCSLKSCPRHFSCLKNVWDETKNVCCGSPNFGVCSSTQHPMLDYSTQQPMTCTPNSPTSCPMGFQCAYSSIRGLYFCCRDVRKIEKCLKGSRPEIWQSTAEPRSCSRDSQCPSTTSCYTPIAFSSGLCCASVDDVCPATYIYESEKSMDTECSPLEKNSCGGDGQSVCLYSEVKGRFVCCRREARQIMALAKCPPGSIVELEKTYCDPENPCQKTHFCMKKSTDRKGICCRHPSLKRVMPFRTKKLMTRKPNFRIKCAKGEQIYKEDGENKQCSGDEDCPEFFKCTIQSMGQSVCCGIPIESICPTKVYPTIKVEKCNLCGAGYECHRSYCCPQKEIACSQPIPSGENGDDSVSRYFYDSETNTCHSFDYSPSNPSNAGNPQNHFLTHESCIEMCVYNPAESDLQCPEPYKNPEDHPQMCIFGQKSCADSETCLKSSPGASICCQNPPTFQLLINNLCGPNYLPTLNKSGNPLRCSSNSRCSSKICRQSPVLRYSICCQRRKNQNQNHQLLSPLSDGFMRLRKICSTEISKNCLPKLYPGETECEIDEQCVSSKCVDKKCQCLPGTVQFRRMCASTCPSFYKNENGICV